MGNVLRLVSAVPPSVNHYLAYRGVMRGGKPMAMSYVTKQALDYKKNFAEYVEQEIIRQGWDVEPTKHLHFYVDATFYFARVDQDANNYFKVLLDAITDTKKIWLDDNVVCERVQRILYDNVSPRIELTIHPIGYIGIFDDVSQYDKFISRCVGCVRYERNCSILKKAYEGRIQDDVAQNMCNKYKAKTKEI